jgi:hypothetical protein
MTERQKFDVVRTFGDWELRDYPEYSVIEVDVSGDFASAGNLGFRPLVQYISGANQSGQSFAMTAPVVQHPQSANEHTVSFVLPEGTDPASIPAARNASVRTRTVPAHRSAAKRFSGSWSAAHFDHQGKELLTDVVAAGLVPEGAVYFARYDPPWKLPFLRHNEALVRIHQP